MTAIPDRLSAALADRYRLERELGQGGMATVYLAHDIKHDRKVAVKVLRPELAAVLGAERFVQEIKTTANLQHPNILPLFDSGEADGFLYYVMPYIEGETLRAKFDREKQLAVDEAVRLTTEVAQALDYAHRHEVIHRDIKPENILLHDGRPLVADFGIALAVSAAAGGRMTETGLSLGTPHYMSPEQATAEKDITPRSDVYSLGAVLYEMLTGNPPHTGSTAQQIIMKIVTEDPAPVTQARKSVPANVAAAVAKALEKVPADRFGSAADVSAALSNSAFRHGEPLAARGEYAPRPWYKSYALPWALLGVTSVALAVALWTGGGSAPAATDQVTRLTIALSPGQAVTSAPAISPDGRTVAFTAARASEPPRLYIRDLDDFEAQVVNGSEGATWPFFSPDGRSIAFYAQGRLFRWDREGGVPRPLAEAPSLPLGGTWGEDGTIVFVPVWNGGLYRVPAGGSPGDAEPLILPDGKEHYAFVFPRFAPDGREVLFTGWGRGWGAWSLDLASGERSFLVPMGTSARVTTSGHLLFAIAGPLSPLLARPWPRGSRAEASGTSVLSGVHQQVWNPDLWLSISRRGAMAYVPSDVNQRTLVRVDPGGRATPVSDLHGAYGNLNVSPDGRRIAADVNTKAWVYGPDGGRVLLAPENRDWVEYNPVWGRDGSRVFYSSNRSGNWEVYARAPGEATAELVVEKEFDQHVAAVADDGTLALSETHPTTGYDIWLLPPGGTPMPWQATEASEVHADFSPDGRWVAYASNVSGRFEIWVGPVQGDTRERIQVTTEGGQAPVWSPNGVRLFYRRGASVMAVAVVSLDPLVLGSHEPLFDGGWELPGPEHPNLRTYDVTPDGEHFVMFRHEPAAIPDRIHVVLNWFEELTERVPH